MSSYPQKEKGRRSDDIHPAPFPAPLWAGRLIMAYEILNTLHLSTLDSVLYKPHKPSPMTTHAQNAALCLIGGWVKKQFSWVDNCGLPHKGFFWLSDQGEILRHVPDICHDLNLINRIERRITAQQHQDFRRYLNNFPLSDRDYVSAMAEDRAEAVLKALKLWK